MAIYRIGPPTPDVEPTRRHLGRVLVTIDDLNALITIMRSEAVDPDSVQVQFNGGYATEAGDISHLSNDEIVSLKIHSDNAEVNLEPTQATAVGTDLIVAKIDNMWARTRQTEIEPDRNYVISSIVSGVAGMLLLGAIPLALLITGLEGGLTYGALIFIPVCTILAIGFAVITMKNVQHARKLPGALIKAMTITEFRQLQNVNQYPRLTWIWAVIATFIAAVAVVVAVITAK
jgi:hypothetical protein